MKHKHIFMITLALIIVISGICAAGCGDSVSQTTLTTINDFNGINTASSQSANGLSLSLSLDSTTYKPGDTINMVVSEKSMLKITNKLLVSDKWPIHGLSVDICGTRSFPFGVAILRGNYTSGNVVTAAPLILYNPNGIVQGCLPPVLNVTAYHFEPLSDIATLDATAIDQSATFEMSTEVSVWSYWAGIPPNAVQHDFEPGVYTVVAGDEWGVVVVVHFTVTK
jgi:hypothetical protein